MSTYNKLKPIYIGGTTNTISSSVGNVSLRVSGNSFLDGNVNINGVSSDLSTTISTLNNKTSSLSYSSGSFSIGTDNSFNTSAITSPINTNGISSGTGDGSSYSFFNLAINSWYGIGFVDTYTKACNIFFNLRTGDINLKGKLNNISTTTLNYLSSVTSDIQNQFNTLTSNLNTTNSTVSSNNTNLQSQITTLQNLTTGISYNSGNDYTDITNNVGVYGNFNFSGNINSISSATFNFLSGVTSNIQTQINSINTSQSTTNNNISQISYNSGANLTNIAGNVNVANNINCDSININSQLILQGELVLPFSGNGLSSKLLTTSFNCNLSTSASSILYIGFANFQTNNYITVQNQGFYQFNINDGSQNPINYCIFTALFSNSIANTGANLIQQIYTGKYGNFNFSQNGNQIGVYCQTNGSYTMTNTTFYIYAIRLS
jgi:hypothetical protein